MTTLTNEFLKTLLDIQGLERVLFHKNISKPPKPLVVAKFEISPSQLNERVRYDDSLRLPR